MEDIFKFARNVLFLLIPLFTLNLSNLWGQVDPDISHINISDSVWIAFKKTHKNNIIGATNILNAEEIMRYDKNYNLSNALIGRIPGLYGSTNNRGIGSFIFLVDGLPRDVSTIKMSEVEQVSFLKDINSSILYGNHAASGIVLIHTKRGKPGKDEINVSANYGISLMKSLPKYLSSAEYMVLYNEARINDGLDILYDDDLIEKYRTGDKYRYPDIDFFSNDFVKKQSPSFNVETEFIGGNDVVTYYANAGWQQTRGFLNFGAGEKERRNKFNIRGNIDVNINRFMKSSVDAAAILNEGFAPTGNNYFETSANFKPNSFTPLLPIDKIDPNNQLLLSRLNDIDGKYLLGGTQGITSNPISIVYSAGLISPHALRTFSFNQKNDVDLRFITEGLSFKTNLSFDFFSTYKQAVRNSYSVYEPVWDENDLIVDLKQYGVDQRTGSQSVTDANYVRRFGGYATVDYDRVFNDVHQIGGSVIGFGTLIKNGLSDIQGSKNFNLGMRANYSFNNKYIIDFSGAYVFSSKLYNKTAFSPSLGLAWIVSSEDFFKSINNVNYLKFRLTGGLVHTDLGIDGSYLYNTATGTSGGYYWYEGQWGNNGTISSRGENLDLTFEERKDINAGVEGLFFNRELKIDFNYFHHIYDQQIVRSQSTYPSFYNHFIPYENFEKTSYSGIDLGVAYNKKLGAVSLTFGANLLSSTSKVLIKDEIFRNKYQYRTGQPADALFALVADGFFEDENDILNHAEQSFGSVQPGDIKYIDQNNDNVIDGEDEIMIGRGQPPLSYGLHLRFEWKNFTFFVLGTGINGSQSFKSGNYYWVDGDDKYSEVVLDRWTQNTKNTAKYPRLSSLSNSNNFRNSTFWLYNNDYFSIDRVQLTYSVPQNITEKLRAQQLDFYLNGASLLRFSKNKKIQDLNTNGTPYSREFSLGMNITF